jgi:hypothetical protein
MAEECNMECRMPVKEWPERPLINECAQTRKGGQDE